MDRSNLLNVLDGGAMISIYCNAVSFMYEPLRAHIKLSYRYTPFLLLGMATKKGANRDGWLCVVVMYIVKMSLIDWQGHGRRVIISPNFFNTFVVG